MNAQVTEVSEPEGPVAITLDGLRSLEAALQKLPPERRLTEEQTTSHHFCDGVYCREFFLPAGAVAVGKMHKRESFFMLVSGVATMSIADGTVLQIRAPYMAVTQPGSKRLVYAHEDATFLTFHPNPENEQDLVRLEEKFIIPMALPAPEEPEKLT